MRNFYFNNLGQSLIGLVVALVIVGLLGGGFYIYLSKQIPKVPEISEKPAEEKAVKPEEELPKEEVVPGKTTPEEKKETKPAEKPIIQKCSDGTLYSQCSANKPKYCDGGNLIDKASSCGCLQNFKVLGDTCVSKKDTSDIIILEEENAGEILSPPAIQDARARWGSINTQNFLKQFYQIYSDNYDFIVVFPTKPMDSNYSIPFGEKVKGTRMYGESLPYSQKLYSQVVMDLYFVWNDPSPHPTSINPTILETILHEIDHTWCCNITGLGIDLPQHWTYNLDLFNGNPAYIDIMSYHQWIRSGQGDTCVTRGTGVTAKFSNLTLYLMGLIPKEQVGPIYVHDFEKKPGEDYFNRWGPDCTASHRFIQTRTITIEDIIQANGVRIPSYANSQKNFRVAFVVLTPKGESAGQGFIDYIKLYKQALPSAWEEATEGKSHIIY